MRLASALVLIALLVHLQAAGTRCGRPHEGARLCAHAGACEHAAGGPTRADVPTRGRRDGTEPCRCAPAAPYTASDLPTAPPGRAGAPASLRAFHAPFPPAHVEVSATGLAWHVHPPPAGRAVSSRTPWSLPVRQV